MGICPRPEDGVFSVESVDPEHIAVDVTGIQLGDLVGYFVALDDLD